MILLDASAALAYLLDEPGGKLVRQNLASSVMTTVNLIEAIRRLRRDFDGEQTKAIYSAFTARLKGVEDVKLEDVLKASEIYAEFQKSHNISLGDAVCLAVGFRLKAEVWTADAIWASLSNVGKVKIVR